MPVNATGGRKANYAKVEEDGLPALDAAVQHGDVIICKRLMASQLGVDKKKRASIVDHSTVLTCSEQMRVDAVFMTTNKDGGRLARIRLRAGRTPVIGDKFSSHHGQKGVIGMTLPAEDMPFTAEGLVPDLVVNPHGLPSRMTVGQLLEMLLGKVCALRGRGGDGTPFSKVEPAAVFEELGRLGFESRGNETFYNGVTGAPLQTTVFVRTSAASPRPFRDLVRVVARRERPSEPGGADRGRGATVQVFRHLSGGLAGARGAFAHERLQAPPPSFGGTFWLSAPRRLTGAQEPSVRGHRKRRVGGPTIIDCGGLYGFAGEV